MSPLAANGSPVIVYPLKIKQKRKEKKTYPFIFTAKSSEARLELAAADHEVSGFPYLRINTGSCVPLSDSIVHAALYGG